MKRYVIDLLMNARDLGGYSTLDGKTIPMGRFIRSDAPHYLTQEGRDIFHALGITTVLDFRTPDIASKFTSTFKDDARFSYWNFPIMEGSNAYSKSEAESPQTYMNMLTHLDTLKDIMLGFIHAPGGVFYNCSAGKDRTGVVTFLLLDLIGVNRQTILEDYAISESFINERITLVREAHPTFPATMGHSKKEWFLRFFELFDETYGSVRKYLLKAGLTADHINQLKKKLTKS